MNTPSHTTPSVRRQRTRYRLLGAALVVFARRGVQGTSIEELCEEAGLTRGAFYSNFASFDDLVLALIDLAVRTTASEIRDILQSAEGEFPASARGAEPTLPDCPMAEHASSTERASVLRTYAGQALENWSVDWTSSIAWVITETEIDLYTLRNPHLRSRYLELKQTHHQTLAAEIEAVLATFGAHTTIPMEVALGHMAAAHLRAAREAIHPESLTLAPVPDASEVLAESLAGGPRPLKSLPPHSLLRPVQRSLEPMLDLLVGLIRFD